MGLSVGRTDKSYSRICGKYWQGKRSPWTNLEVAIDNAKKRVPQSTSLILSNLGSRTSGNEEEGGSSVDNTS